MLGLDDPLWAELTHAYGGASDIPDLLRALAVRTVLTKSVSEEPWFTLWSSLCHQGDVYTASYAAIPHIVDIASTAIWPIDFSFLELPAAVEVARRTGRGPEIPAVLTAAYHHALERLIDVIGIHLREVWDEPMLHSVFAALAVSKGDIATAEAMINLDSDWVERIRNCDFD